MFIDINMAIFGWNQRLILALLLFDIVYYGRLKVCCY